MTIRWSARARSDIRDLQKHIAKDSPYYARQFIGKIFGAVEKLVDHPRIGRQVPEADLRRCTGTDLSRVSHYLRHKTRLCLHRHRCARQPRFAQISNRGTSCERNQKGYRQIAKVLNLLP
ncbi:MAG: type II toxin-antitoxin system RelE/ParE family toxin [Gammaproteobacteria bacterium]